ncbi:hypothetical protein JHW43_002632 [Diplocarpon mali]|nr:hypothetical protein JHW43_002632 [Diplocarpon mali]
MEGVQATRPDAQMGVGRATGFAMAGQRQACSTLPTPAPGSRIRIGNLGRGQRTGREVGAAGGQSLVGIHFLNTNHGRREEARGHQGKLSTPTELLLAASERVASARLHRPTTTSCLVGAGSTVRLHFGLAVLLGAGARGMLQASPSSFPTNHVRSDRSKRRLGDTSLLGRTVKDQTPRPGILWDARPRTASRRRSLRSEDVRALNIFLAWRHGKLECLRALGARRGRMVQVHAAVQRGYCFPVDDEVPRHPYFSHRASLFVLGDKRFYVGKIRGIMIVIIHGVVRNPTLVPWPPSSQLLSLSRGEGKAKRASSARNPPGISAADSRRCE